MVSDPLTGEAVLDWARACEILRAKDAPAVAPAAEPVTIETAAEHFLKTRETKSLYRGNRQLLREFRHFMEAPPRQYRFMTQVRFTDLTDFCSGWKLAVRTKLTHLSCLITFLRYCHRAEFTPGYLGTGLSRTLRLSDKAAPKEPFTPEELERIWNALPRYKEPSSGHKPEDVQQVEPFVYLMRYTGMDLSTTVTLPKASVRGNQILTYRLKNGSEVWTVIPEWLAEMLWQVPHSSELYFFTSGRVTRSAVTRTWSRRLRFLLNMAGLPHRTSHNFRHHFAVEHLLNGTPIEDVSRLLGHNDIRVTLESYAAWVKERQEKLEQHQQQVWGSDPLHQRMK